MNLALPYTASATDASDILISAPDAAHMSLDACFQNRFRSVLIGKSLGFIQKAGRSMHGLSSIVDNNKLFKSHAPTKERGKHSLSLGLVAKILGTNSNPKPSNNQYS